MKRQHRHHHYLFVILSVAVVQFHLSHASNKNKIHHHQHHLHNHLQGESSEPYLLALDTDSDPEHFFGKGLSPELISRLETTRDQGIAWLLSQATEDDGWPVFGRPGGIEKAKLVVALASSVENWPTSNDFVANLIIKQLEVELIEKLLRAETESFTPEQVAFFALGLHAALKDPHNFYGHNIAASLEKHHNSVVDFPGHPETYGFSFTSLVSCLLGSHLHKRRIKHLIQIAKEHSEAKPYFIDAQGITLMALECIRHRSKEDVYPHHLHGPLEAVALTQNQEDGSFGSVLTTSIAIQTLAASRDPILSWNKTAAALALINFQLSNGSFLNSMDITAESVVAATTLLNGLGIFRLLSRPTTHPHHDHHHHFNNNDDEYEEEEDSIRKKKQFSYYVNDEIFHQILQHGVNQTTKTSFSATISTSTSTSTRFLHQKDYDDDEEVEAPVTESSSVMVFVKYFLWVGSDASTARKHNLTLQLPENLTFFAAMRRAAEFSKDFEFASVMWPNGHYVHTITGEKEEPSENQYWLLYLLSQDPDPKNPPSASLVAPTGVDRLHVSQGQVYLFWYKKI